MSKTKKHTPPPDSTQVRNLALKLGRELTSEQAEAIAVYLGMLVQWNRKMNLVGHDDWKEIMTDLIADSWHLADFLQTIPLPDDSVSLDFGAGAGLPGIPLRVFWEEGVYYLVEAREKRSLFMTQVIGKMGLNKTFVRQMRVEALPEKLHDAGLIVSRAFMPWQEYLSLAGQYLGQEGVAVVMANEEPTGEVPAGFRKFAETSYTVSGKQRLLLAFTYSQHR